jgi:YhcH/YjgK/YiaL family protein
MISGHIANLAHDLGILPPKLARGLRFLAETDFAKLAPGRIDVDGDEIFALVQDYETLPKAECRPETHRTHLDIQFVASGREIIGQAPLLASAEVVDDRRDTPADIAFFADPANETDVLLEAGGWAVFHPWDIHRPRVAAGIPSAVRKVVVKIRLGD